MKKYAVLTHNLKTLVIENNKIVQRYLDANIRTDSLVGVARFGDDHSFVSHDDRNSWFDFETARFGRSIPNGYFELRPVPKYAGYNIKYKDSFLRADSSFSVSFVEKNPSLWETFRLIEVEKLSLLAKMLDAEWSINRSGDLVKFSKENSTFSNLSLGDNQIELDQVLNSLENRLSIPKELLFFNKWSPNKAILVNPVIVFVLFGHGNVLSEFEASMESLDSFGEYEGDIVIVGNLDEDQVRNLVPRRLAGRIKFVRMDGQDRLDFVGARISVFNTTILDEYQPILYTDADVIFDNSLTFFLTEAAHSSHCSAQIEDFASLKGRRSTGAKLYSQDPFTIEDVKGFNAGILMIPNMEKHQRTLRAAFKAITLYTSENGRDSIPFYDQSILNYVLYKLGDFSPYPVTDFTAIGGADILKENLQRKGLVHFWRGFKNRGVYMKEYIRMLRHNADVEEAAE